MKKKNDGKPVKQGPQGPNKLNQNDKSKEHSRKESIPSSEKERHPEDQSNESRRNRNRGSGEGEIGMDRGAGHPTGR
jgi:hypothetical protein